MSDRPDRGVVLRLAGEALCDPRTVERWLLGRRVRRLVAERLVAAQARLDARRALERSLEPAA